MTAPTTPATARAINPTLARLAKRARDRTDTLQKKATLTLTASLYAGDHWAKGKGWAGPMPAPTEKGATLLLTEIERVFVSRNLIRDVIYRHQAAVAGREPIFNIVLAAPPTEDDIPEQDAARMAEYQAALTSWWDERDAWTAVQDCLRTALWSGKGTVRLYIPRSSLTLDAAGNTVMPSGALEDVIKRIRVHAPAHDQAGVLTDEDGEVEGAYYTRATADGQTRLELQLLDGEKVLVYPDVSTSGEELASANTFPVPDLLLYEVTLDPLISESVISLQKLANKALTMLSRNVDLGGFVERTLLNAQLPGKMIADETAPTKQRFVPDPINLGAGVVNAFQGVPIKDEKGKTTGYATPSVVYKDPVAVATFKDTFEAAREAIFDETKQLHVLTTADGSVNGVSRQQSVNDFVMSLEPTRIALERLMRWLLSTVLRLALFFASRQGEFDAYRVRAQARLAAVQPTPSEIEVAMKLRDAGLISEETAMGRVGVEDVDAERATRAAEQVTLSTVFKMAAAGLPMFAVMEVLSKLPGFEWVTPEMIEAQRAVDQAGYEPPVTEEDEGEVANGNLES